MYIFKIHGLVNSVPKKKKKKIKGKTQTAKNTGYKKVVSSKRR